MQTDQSTPAPGADEQPEEITAASTTFNNLVDRLLSQIPSVEVPQGQVIAIGAVAVAVLDLAAAVREGAGLLARTAGAIYTRMERRAEAGHRDGRIIEL